MRADIPNPFLACLDVISHDLPHSDGLHDLVYLPLHLVASGLQLPVIFPEVEDLSVLLSIQLLLLL